MNRPAASAPEVTIATGHVRGSWRGDSAAFLGIPFAEPPVGGRRFAAPEPKAPWSGVLDATAYGPTPQRQQLSETTLIPEPSVPGESTLNVNVFTPTPGRPSGRGLPVLVWIHGGGFVAGSPASPWYDGRSFNRDGVVTVSISYRLGFDGFGWIEGAPQNRGVLDWLLALRWVQENIAAFGGDPARVTIAGQSAGGAAVLTLLGMPAAEGLFAGAWSLSGLVPGISADAAQRYAVRLAGAAGVAPGLAGFSSMGEAELLTHQNALATEGEGEATRQGPLEAARAPARALVTDGLALGPVVDGEVVPVATLEAYRSGVGRDVPLVLGATDDEFSLLIHGSREPLDALTAPDALRALGLAEPRLEAYVADHQGFATSDLIGRYVTDRLFRSATLEVLAARAGSRSWLYRFAWPSPVFGDAVHCLDVPFWFDCLDSERVEQLAGPTPPQALADELHRAAVDFVVEADPGWPSWSEPQRPTRVFDTPSTVESDGYADTRALLE